VLGPLCAQVTSWPELRLGFFHCSQRLGLASWQQSGKQLGKWKNDEEQERVSLFLDRDWLIWAQSRRGKKEEKEESYFSLESNNSIRLHWTAFDCSRFDFLSAFVFVSICI